jgi:hypothetical protein
MSYHETFFNFIFYLVELTYFIAVIAYVAHTLGFYKPKFMKNNVPSNFDSTLNSTADFLEKAAKLATRVNEAWSPKEEGDDDGEDEEEARPPKAKAKAIQAKAARVVQEK